MAALEAEIKPFDPADDKLVRFTVGRACMGGLATANRKTFFHPIVLSIWVGLSCMLIQYFNWWPNPQLPWWTYLRPIPSFAAWAVPVMFAIDWYNRPFFEERTQKVLRQADLFNIAAYYARSPSSGIWILRYGPNFVGLIAIDASLDALTDQVVTDVAKDDKKYLQNLAKKGTSPCAVIRHFYVMEEYRASDVQDDLLEYAINHAFESDKAVKSIRATEDTIETWLPAAYDKQRFIIEKMIANVGTLGWAERTRLLTKSKWEEAKGKKKQ